MTDSVREQLLGYLLGALDDAERESVELRLQRDPEWRKELLLVRRQLEPLASCRPAVEVPPGLAEQTSRLVAEYRQRQEHLASEPRSRAEAARNEGLQPMTPEAALPGWAGRIRWADLATAVGIFLAASLVVFPALQSSRFQARVRGCQNKLRELGVAMKQHSLQHNGYFPVIPTEGRLAAAGFYAPVLRSEDLLTDPGAVVCPGAEPAGDSPYFVPTLEEIRSATPQRLSAWREVMRGSYGYCLGYRRDGVYHPTRDLNRSDFVLMADPPSSLPGYQSLNHGGRGQNVLYEDGRVRFLTSSKPYQQADDYYVNELGLNAAGTHANDSVIGSIATPPVVFIDNRY